MSARSQFVYPTDTNNLPIQRRRLRCDLPAVTSSRQQRKLSHSLRLCLSISTPVHSVCLVFLFYFRAELFAAVALCVSESGGDAGFAYFWPFGTWPAIKLLETIAKDCLPWAGMRDMAWHSESAMVERFPCACVPRARQN